MDEKQEKTIYTASLGEIARKNFVAGLSRALGGFAITLISWGVIYLIIIKLLLPPLLTTVDKLQNILQLLPKNNSTTQGTTLPVPANLMQQLQGK